MEILKNSSSESLSLRIIKGGRKTADVLMRTEMDLLRQVTQVFQVIQGGHFRSRQSHTLSA